ncbi:MAG TPA: hypothetical protein VLA26_04640 [Gammaproteobacteria bacterium]|nr:hypothetical protein [Gammaproteobacteria bacterium]
MSEPNKGQNHPSQAGGVGRCYRRHAWVCTLGLASISLYVLLKLFSPELVQLAQATHAGNKGLFFVPILLALVFSFVHGAFTSHFWDVLGVKAKD